MIGRSEFIIEIFVVGGGPDHGGVVSDEFIAFGKVNWEVIFFGDGAGEGAERDVAHNSTSKENHLGRVEVDRAAEAGHEVFEDGLLKGSGEVRYELTS